MTTLNSLRELEKRLVEAKGEDRSLDADMQVLLFQKQNEHYLRPFRHPILLPQEHRWPGTLEYVDISGVSVRAAEKFTASLDAAVSLVERVLPDYRWIVDKDCDRAPRYAAQVKERGATWKETPRPFADTPALALCLACIRALISQGEQ